MRTIKGVSLHDRLRNSDIREQLNVEVVGGDDVGKI